MSESRYDFCSFIDHYILLLSARFNAPLDAISFYDNNSSSDNSNNNNSPMELWKKVARCVQDALAHPQTPAERRELANIDVSLFTAEVCRDRALYFRWQLQQQTLAAAATAPSMKKRTAKVKGNPETAPSLFDITRDSIKEEVESIYAAVRASLPSTLGIQEWKSTTKVGEEEVADTSNSGGRNNAVLGGYEGEDNDETDDDSVVDVVEFAMRSELQESRDRVIAEARDVLLTKIQRLQAEFYAEHRRWVDVPYDLDITPSTGTTAIAAAAAAPFSSPSVGNGVGKTCEVDCDIEATLQVCTEDATFPHMFSKSAMREALETSKPKKTVVAKNAATTTSIMAEEATSSSTSFIEVLKQSVHVKRPPRPSQMREEDYKAEYNDIMLLPPNGTAFNAATEFASSRKATETSGCRPPKVQEDEQGQQEEQLGLRSVNAVAAMEPGPQRLRGNRWGVVEYDNDSDQES